MALESDNLCREDLFEDIFKQHSQNLFQFLYYKYGSDSNPTDIVQEAFIKLWENCANVSPEKARAFLFTVANNSMLNQIARKKTVVNFSKREQKNYTLESPQFILEETEYSDQLANALAELSEDQRVTFMLNRVEGKRHKEIAEMLGISRKAVEKRIYTALAILRKKLGNI